MAERAVFSVTIHIAANAITAGSWLRIPEPLLFWAGWPTFRNCSGVRRQDKL